MPYISTTSYLDYFWKFIEFPDREVPYFPLYPQNHRFWDLKNLKFEQILSIFYSFLEMSKIAQYFDYIDLRPSKGSRNQRSSSKDLPQSPLLSVAGFEKRQKRRKNTKNEPLLGPRARNIHIPVARREGPLKGPHQKWPKTTQKRPKIDPFEGVESLPNP